MEVYNATRGGALEVFPRVNLDEIFKELEVKKMKTVAVVPIKMNNERLPGKTQNVLTMGNH